MEITYQGGSCFRLRGKETIVLLDPPAGHLPGLAKAAAGFLLHTAGPTNLDVLRPREGRRQEVAGPGEYEIGGVSVMGLAAGEATVMRIDIDDTRVVAVGNLLRPLSSEEIDALGQIDVLLLPLNGPGSLEPVNAVKLVNTLEPSTVIPVATGITPDGVDPVLKFSKEMGLAEGAQEPLPKLVINGSLGETTEVKVVLLESKTAA